MISICDRTLSCLTPSRAQLPALKRFLTLLIETGVESIELSEAMYAALAPLPEHPAYVLRMNDATACARYPAIKHFVCAADPLDREGCGGLKGVRTAQRVTQEQRADTKASLSRLFAEPPSSDTRLSGLGFLATEDYLGFFGQLKAEFPQGIELCPTDETRCATALAVEWALTCAGARLVGSFGGIGGFAPTEELIMCLRTQGLRQTSECHPQFPEMAALLQLVTGRETPPAKAVLGSRIFLVESGIHVDGIAKQPRCYEPFPPEEVGQKRTLLLGRQSGVGAVRMKLREQGFRDDGPLTRLLCDQVRQIGAASNKPVADREFFAMAHALGFSRLPQKTTSCHVPTASDGASGQGLGASFGSSPELLAASSPAPSLNRDVNGPPGSTAPLQPVT
ncbi:MAG: hypothetical protein LBG81_08020, partial [Coriobacteriaceae bacterium]|nr:hypothetical protein [Coriobacteriaceae bacterium]